MVFCASSANAVALHHDATFFLKRQLVWLIVALGAALLAYRVDYRQLRKAAPVFLGLCVAALLLVFVPHVGVYVGRSAALDRPRPVVLPALGVREARARDLSCRRARHQRRAHPLARARPVPAVFITLLMAVLVLKEPDMGTASLLVFTASAMFFAAGARPAHLGIIGLTVALGVVALIKHDPYKRARVSAFIDPWKDPQNTGFHIVQSLLALGSGGLFGLGLGVSRQKFFYLPERTPISSSRSSAKSSASSAALIVVLFVVFAYRAIRIALQRPIASAFCSRSAARR